MCNAQMLSSLGRYGDTEIAHVNPQEKQMLENMGGSGTTNPMTGLKEYHSKWYPHSHASIPTPKIIPPPTPKIIPPPIPKIIPPPTPKIILDDAPDIAEQVDTFVDKNTKSLPEYDVEEQYQDSTIDQLLEGDLTLDQAVDKNYQGGDIDFFGEAVQYIWNEVDKMRKGEQTQTEQSANDTKDIIEDYSDTVQDLPDQFYEQLDTLGNSGVEGFNSLISSLDKNSKATSEGGITPVTRGGEELVEEDLATLQNDPKSHLRRKKRGKKQFRISSPGVNVGGGGSGLKIA